MSGVSAVYPIINGTVQNTNIYNGSQDVNYTISSSGTYSFKIVDVVGHAVTADLVVIPGDSSAVCRDGIVIDPDVPVITITKTPSKEWYNATPVVNVSVTDRNLKNVKVTLNGNKIADTSSSSFNLDLSNLQEGSNNIVVTATDKTGSYSEASTLVKLDVMSPVITITKS